MTPEAAICDIVTQVFPGSTCRTWRESQTQYTHFEYRLVAGERVWGLEHVIPDELVDAHPDAAARELVARIRDEMRAEMAREVEVATVFTSPLSGMPMRATGFTNDGWYDTDKRRRDDARLLELARMETQRQEEEKAKASILDAITKKAMRDVG